MSSVSTEPRTRRRTEEVEEGVVLHGLGDGARAAPRLVLLLLLDGLECDVLALLPVYRAALPMARRHW